MPYPTDITDAHGGHDYVQQPVESGMALLHRASGVRGALKKFTGELVVLKDRKGGEHTFRNEPGAFAYLGETVTLVRAGAAPRAARATRACWWSWSTTWCPARRSRSSRRRSTART